MIRPRKKHENANAYIWEITKDLSTSEKLELKRKFRFDKENRKYVPLIEKFI